MIGRLLKTLGYERRVTDYNPSFIPSKWNAPSFTLLGTSPAVVAAHSAVAARASELKRTLLASVPFSAYQRQEDGTRARLNVDTPLGRLLARPNSHMTLFEVVEWIVHRLDYDGDAFLQVEYGSNGAPVALHPVKGTLEQLANGRVRLKVQSSDGRGTAVLLDHEFIHVKDGSDDGLRGVSRFARSRAALGLEVAANEAAGDLAANGLRMQGIITHPGKLSGQAKTNIAASVLDRGGDARSDKVKVFEEGMKWVPTSQSAADAQLVESLKHTAVMTALVMGVPPAALGLTESVAYASAAQAHLDLITQTLAPLAARIEAAFQRTLCAPEDGRFFEFNLTGLLRADPTTRWQTYRTAVEAGAFSANDVRRLENLPPVEGGDVYARGLIAPNEPAGSETP